MQAHLRGLAWLAKDFALASAKAGCGGLAADLPYHGAGV